jgi:DNA-binding NarL/FixJ family response regulator
VIVVAARRGYTITGQAGSHHGAMCTERPKLIPQRSGIGRKLAATDASATLADSITTKVETDPPIQYSANAELNENAMKILLADDHALFREGMRHVLARLGDDISIVEAGDYAQVLEQAATHADIGLVLLDLHMPGKDGFAALEMLSRQYPTLPIVVLSASENRADMQRALDAGAMGFIQKSATASVMLSALGLVLAGGVYVPPALVQLGGEVTTPAAGDDVAGLTPRQLDVLRYVIDGKTNKVIAAELGLTEATVKAHITAVFRTLKVTNRTQAALAAERLGIHRGRR